MPTADAEQVPAAGSPRRDRRRGRRLRGSATALVLLVLVAAAVSHQLELGRRWLGLPEPSPVTEPALVPPPAGLVLPRPGGVPAVARTPSAAAVSSAAVRRAVAGHVRSRRLGPHVVVHVARLHDGGVVYRHGAGPVTPASTLKLLTAVAALQALGPGHRFATSVVAAPRNGRVVLVGGGDPLLAREPQPVGTYPDRADLTTLARRTARALRATGRRTVRVGFDTSLFTGPAVSPRWEPSYVPDDVVSPVSPLWVDEGREPGSSDRSPDPARAAADVFVRALGRQRIAVTGPLTRAVAPPASTGGRTLARVLSAPLDEVVQHVLEVSDNEGAEVLARQVAVARGEPASFVGAGRAVRQVLSGLGVPVVGARIHDGSGLSRANRLSPATLLAVVRTASDDRHPALRGAVANLPVAGFTGSLATRFTTGDPAGLGTVRAKTGTLTGVHGLAGTVTTRDGAVLAFLALADRVRPARNLEARVMVDRVAAALAGCRCTR